MAIGLNAPAACAEDGYDPDLWLEPFQPDAEDGTEDPRLALARSICNSCPAQAECLGQAMERKLTGAVYGGLTDAQRRALRIGEGVRRAHAERQKESAAA